MHEFFIGYLSNVIPIYMVYPLDTYMVRRQTSNTSRLSLYRGVNRIAHMNGLLNGCISSIYFQEGPDPSFSNMFCASMVSGVLGHPIENRKIFLQSHFTDQHKMSVWRGLHLTCAREVVGIPIYFETYSFFKKMHSKEEQVSPMNSFLYGGLAGIHSWFWSYPLSTIRANVILYQTISYTPFFLYKGFTTCAVRSFFLNGMCFTCREFFRDLPSSP